MIAQRKPLDNGLIFIFDNLFKFILDNLFMVSMGLWSDE